MASAGRVCWTSSRAIPIARFAGEIDETNAASLFEHVAATAQGRMVVVDLTDVIHIDSSGLGWLAGLSQRNRLRLVATPRGPIDRLLEITGLAEFIPLFATVDDAVTASYPPAS